MRIAVSACLLGENCKYNGGNNYSEKLVDYIKGNDVLSVCPEVMGGLPVPRESAEIVNGVVSHKDGTSVDKEFRKGAKKALEIVKEENVKIKYYILSVIRIATGLKIARDKKYPEIEHISHIGDILPEKIYKEIKRILKLRTEFFEEIVPANEILDCFIKENVEMLNTISDSIETKERNQAKLDELFFEIVKEEIFKEYTVKEIFGC